MAIHNMIDVADMATHSGVVRQGQVVVEANMFGVGQKLTRVVPVGPVISDSGVLNHWTNRFDDRTYYST